MLDAIEKSRLAWHCRRGMLELDLILQSFLHLGLDSLDDRQIEAFDALLDNTDPELYAWLMGHEDPHNKELSEIVTIIRTTS